MSDIVNLNRARKARAQAADKAQAAQNRVKHGRSKPQRATEEADRLKAVLALDAVKRDP